MFRNRDHPLTQELIENHLQVCHLQIKHDALCEELEAINKATESWANRSWDKHRAPEVDNIQDSIWLSLT